MAIKVVDLNEEATETKDEPPAIEQVGDFLNSNTVGVEPIEEEPKEEPIETSEVANEVVEEVNEEVKEEIKEETKPNPKPKPKPKASDIVPCPDCNKNMTYKNLRYSHKCYPEPPPVKRQAKPKAKQQPKPKPKPTPEIYYSDEEEEVPTQPCMKKKQLPQPINPTSALAQHYQLLQQAFIKQKQERYNSLCMNMFSTKTKKR